MDADSALKEVGATNEGLSSSEAEARLVEHGKNKLKEGKKISIFSRFLKQICDPMMLVLIAAAILSGVTAVYSGESLTDVFIILFVVLLNAVLGVLQESKAEEAIEALKQMTAAESKVLRDGEIKRIKSEDLTVGDVILLEAGDSVPADARLLESASLKAEEAALTGESVPVEKSVAALEGESVALGDRVNMVYMGSTIAYGRGRAVVTGVGMETEMGRIAGALSDAKDNATPLQKKLAGLSKILTWLVLGICVVVFAVGMIRAGSFTLDSVLNTFMLAISLAVAAIPEGLAAVVTIVLSIGVTRMSKNRAVIRKLSAVETLGCAQIICSDKTGTLTQNKMTVMESSSPDDAFLARAMALASDAEVKGDSKVIGEPTEAALVTWAMKIGYPKPILKKEEPRVSEIPFDSDRKRMTTLCKRADGSYIQYTKGAPDEILAVCDRILTPNGVAPMTDADRASIAAENKQMADRALRVLAAAYTDRAEIPADFTPRTSEKGLIYIGLCGMIDPIRPEVRDAVKLCHTAGVKVVMITGDHMDTATAIGRDLGILGDGERAVPGSVLDDMSDEELVARIDEFPAFARVQPEHKVRIVNAWKTRGMITAMTGDGVNDAPSIKSADIGIGMGITGTDVTKSVADMILADDNFATIVSAVEEGRRIYANLRRAVQFLLSSNMSEVIAVFFATMFGFTLLKPAHILWINLITDTFPALALGMEAGERDAMQKPPRPKAEGLFANGVGISILYQGAVVAILTLFAYLLGHWIEAGVWELTASRDGMTMAFLTLSMAEIFQSFNMRSLEGSIFTIRRQNKWLWGAGAAALVLTTAVIYIPFFAKAFEFETVSLGEYFISLGLAFLVIPIVEAVKLIRRIVKKKKATR
jgi:Ca2+-transporting ATPase